MSDTVPEELVTDVELVLLVKGAEPHTLAKAKLVVPDKEGEYYHALAEMLEGTAKHLRKDAGK